LTDLAGARPEEVCEALPGLVANPPPPAGTRVRLEERPPVPKEGDDDRAAFTYAAVRSSDVLDVVRVDLRREDTWRWNASASASTPGAPARVAPDAGGLDRFRRCSRS
jgi:hypothetical protein